MTSHVLAGTRNFFSGTNMSNFYEIPIFKNLFFQNYPRSSCGKITSLVHVCIRSCPPVQCKYKGGGTSEMCV